MFRLLPIIQLLCMPLRRRTRQARRATIPILPQARTDGTRALTAGRWVSPRMAFIP